MRQGVPLLHLSRKEKMTLYTAENEGEDGNE
ncbi:putative uncharacterized protein [Ruminococcus sp. CAG:17]|jgi:hypothetical protein|nr:hypothetical protein CK1_10410 [Ruminococcus sp. SR1/5]CCY98053.1 putative uncharacterized protein [Ruminococcus sp. CAG:17]SCG98031.1 Uncharacterised protein [uncultured Blautia sp.]